MCNIRGRDCQKQKYCIFGLLSKSLLICYLGIVFLSFISSGTAIVYNIIFAIPHQSLNERMFQKNNFTKSKNMRMINRFHILLHGYIKQLGLFHQFFNLYCNLFTSHHLSYSNTSFCRCRV